LSFPPGSVRDLHWRLIVGCNILLDWLPRVFEIAFYGFSCLGFLGVSVLVTFAADIVQVATLHLCICNIIATAVIRALMLYASTLWNLFHGMVDFLSLGEQYSL
jgi:hypothetical protein